MTPAKRFWAKVDKIDAAPDACWQWLGTKSDGYGRFSIGSKRIYAHRFAYELLIGPIPDGLTLDHLCRNRACVKPQHVEPVPMRTNILRGNGRSARNAVKAHCPQGHPYSGSNLYIWSKWRYCLTCGSERKKLRSNSIPSLQSGMKF